MKRYILILLIPVFFACKKGKTSPAGNDFREMDLEALMNSDDYFKNKRNGNTSKVDSIETRLVRLNDINRDGISDSAIIRYNNNNSIYTVSFSCYSGIIRFGNVAELQIRDMEDLNGDGHHEILFFLQSEESCWDEIRLYSWLDKWVEKYQGLTYQCTEGTNYQFRKIDDRTVQLTTYGASLDSLDSEVGDTLENLLPDYKNSHLIRW